MRKITSLVVLFFIAVVFTASAKDELPSGVFDVYTEKNASKNHFIPCGWMGDVGDLQFSDDVTEKPFAGTTCMKITYTAKRTQGNGWAGIQWLSAANNWGTKDTGFDLSGLNKLTFKVRGKNGGEIISLIKIGGIIKNKNGEMVDFPDSFEAKTGPIRLTKDWQEYSINLADKNLNYVNGGFSITFSADQINNEQVIYIDDIVYTYDPEVTTSEITINFPFYVYADVDSLDNHFSPSGWMPATAGRDLKVETKNTVLPYSGKTCIRIEYKDNSKTGWAGIYWQQPASNWGGTPDAGYNLQGAKKLTFWARGEKGGETINEFKVGGISSGEYIDSDTASVGPIQLSKDWKKYEIDLQGKDLSYIIGGFAWATNNEINNPEGIVFYLDEIKYEK